MLLKKFIAILSILTMFSPLLMASELMVSTQGFDAIYGNDDRFDTDYYPDNKKRELAKSVASMVPAIRLFPNPNGDEDTLSFNKRTASQFFGLCPDERFSEQFVLSSCSGFLIAPDIMVTAGHCMQSTQDCELNKWVFDFKQDTNEIPAKNVYSCKEIIKQRLDESPHMLQDYAVIRLDKEVSDRKPLKTRKRGILLPGTKLFIIGHPLGLPQKIAGGAKVSLPTNSELKTPIKTTLKRRYYFSAGLDAYMGNSGSPVFNERTNRVEGIFVKGKRDIFFDDIDKCYRSVRASNKRNDIEEEVFRIRKIKF